MRKIITLKLNYEVSYSRGINEGKYIANLHLYREDKTPFLPINAEMVISVVDPKSNKRKPAPKLSSWLKANPKTVIDEALESDFRSDDWSCLAHHPDPDSYNTLLCYYTQEQRIIEL